MNLFDSIMESGSYDSFIESKNEMNLNFLKKVKINDVICKKYGLIHVKVNKNTDGYVFLKDDDLVGFISVENKDDGSKWIQALEVRPKYRKFGIGKSLLDYAVKELKADHLSVRKTNDVALNMYKKYGFKEYDSTDSMIYMSINSIITESTDKSVLDKNFKKKIGIQFDFVDIRDPKVKGKIDTIHGKYKDHFKGFAAFEKNTNNFAGFVRVWSDWITNGWHGNLISPIEVTPKYRGYGLGKLLIEKAIKKYNANYLFVNEDNEIAIKLYKSLGFRISDTLSHEEGDEDGDGKYYIMTLPSARKEETAEVESVIIDKRDIYHNKDKFESGEINLCFITGHSGSGKSTLGKSLSKKDDTEYFELDDVVANYNFSDDNLKEYGDLIYSFFKSSGKPYRFTSRKEFENTDFKDRYKDYDIKIIKAFVDHSIKYAKSHTSNKYVVEGVELFWCIEPKYVEDYAVYIKGTSALKSMHRAAKRDQDPGVLGYLDLFLDLNRLKTYRIYEKDLNKWYSYYSKLDKEEVVTEKSNYIIEDIYGVEKDNEWNAIVKVKGINKPLRGRSEILILKDDKVFLCFDRPTSIDKKYRLPGGGWNKDEDHMKSAVREAEEEARIKTKNIMYYDTYIDVYDTPKRWVEERIPEKYWWYGYYTDVYVGEYDGKYTGYINIQDRDSDMVKDGDFYDIKEVWDILNDFHKEAIEKYKESQIKTESSNIISYREDMLDKVKEALQSGLEMNDALAKKLISKDSYDQFIHGESKGRIGDENCICIAGLNKDNFNKAYEIVKNTIKGTDFTVNKDNYFTLFLSDKNKVEKESSYEYFEERSLPSGPVTLYHGSWDASYIKLMENSPNRKQFKNLDISISDSHFWSIDWFDKKEYAIARATATLLNKVSKGRMISFVDKDAKVLVPEEFKDIAKIILKNNKSYVYIKNISRMDISNYKLTKYDGYKLEPEVIPDSVHVNTYKEMISLIKYVSYRYVMSKGIEDIERRLSASSINESIDDSIYEVEEIMRENAFDTLYYGLDDVFIEASAKAETSIIKEQIYPIAEKTLSDPNGDRKFRLLVKKFLDKHASKLNTAGPTYMIPFTDDDKEEFFRCFNTTKANLTKPIIQFTNLVNDKAGWKSLRQNPIFCLFYSCVRYYTLKKDEKGLNIALIIYALSVYPSRYSVFFQYGANADVMDYTIDNLSSRFLFKQQSSVLETLMTSIQHSYSTLKDDFITGDDNAVIRWVSRIRNDQNSLLKNIASEYYANYRKNARIVTQSETYADNEMIDDNLNDTSVVEDVTRRISTNIITNGVDITRATAAAKLAGVSISDLRFYLTRIITRERNEELNKFIESIVFIYLYQENHKPYEINEMKFLQFGSDLFRRTNSNDPNVSTIKELLNVWSQQSGINDRYKRIASQINYKRGIFMYVVLCIQYYNQK